MEINLEHGYKHYGCFIASLNQHHKTLNSFVHNGTQSGSMGITDEEAVAVLRKLAKQRQESVDMYKAAKSETGDKRAAQEQMELEIIGKWLPSLAGTLRKSNTPYLSSQLQLALAVQIIRGLPSL